MLSVEFFLCITVIIGAFALLVGLRYFGKAALQGYISIGVIVANIQVLTAAHVIGYPYMIPQGTAVFSTVFLANNLLTEFYGKEAATKGIWLGFFFYLIFSVFLYITILTPQIPVSPDHSDYHFTQAYEAVTVLFAPSFGLLAASLIAYMISQYTDMGIYYALRQRHSERLLWLRSLLANITSATIDNVVFTTLLLLFVFNTHTLSWETAFLQYMGGSYLLRFLVAIINIPTLYAAKALARSFRVAYKEEH